MPIQIQTNFNSSEQSPIDSRSVVQNLSDLDNIVYKYEGLKVYVRETKITYEWTPDNTWKIDDNFRKKGLYGGTGSIPNDIVINQGIVNQQINSVSKILYQWVSTGSGVLAANKPITPSNRLLNYFKRRSVGTGYDSISYLKQLVYFQSTESGTDNLPPTPSCNIEFNGLDPLNQQITGSLVFNTENGSKFLISPKNYFAFFTSDNPSNELPITITEFNSEKYLGFNFNPYNNDKNYTFNNTKPAHRIKFGDNPNSDGEITFESKFANRSSFTTPLKIQSLNYDTTSQLDSTQIHLDRSSRSWDSISTQNYGLTNLVEFFRNYEQRYTRAQFFNSADTTLYTLTSGVLLLPPNGNVFNISLAGGTLNDIKLRKNNQNYDYPNGTILYFKTTTPGNIGLYSKKDPTKRTSKIYFDTDDTLFLLDDDSFLNTGSAGLPLLGFPLISSGMIFTVLRINNFWEIINVNSLFRRCQFRLFRKGGEGSGTTPDWAFEPVTYLDRFDSTGRFIAISGANCVYEKPLNGRSNHRPSIYSSGVGTAYYNTPNTFEYSETAIGSTKETALVDFSKATWELSISLSIYKISHITGNFTLKLGSTRNTNPGSSAQNFFWTSDGNPTIEQFNKDDSGVSKERENIFRIGKITNPGFMPKYENTWFKITGWGFVESTSTSDNRKIKIVDPILRITRSGWILLSFKAQPTWTISSRNDLVLNSWNIVTGFWVGGLSYPTADLRVFPTT